MSTNFVYGSGNPLFQAPKKSTPAPTPKPSVKKPDSTDQLVKKLQENITGLTKEEARLNEILKQEQDRLSRVPAGGGGSGGTTLTDEQIRENERAYQRQQDAAAEAEKKRRAGQSAYDLLLSEFNQYGLGSLVEPLKALIVSGPSEAELTLALRQTEPYKKRFAANASRLAKGLRALSEAEYITLEDQYQNVMRNYGLPATYYTKDSMGRQEGFEKFIAGDVYYL